MSVSFYFKNNNPIIQDECFCTFYEGETAHCKSCRGTGILELSEPSVNMTNAVARNILGALGLLEDPDELYGEIRGENLPTYLRKATRILNIRSEAVRLTEDGFEEDNLRYQGVELDRVESHLTALQRMFMEAIEKQDSIYWG